MYDFSLTKIGHQRQTIIKIIKENIPDVLVDATQRWIRSMSHNHGDIWLQLDEENALVASDDEDETSQSCSSSSGWSEGEGISVTSDGSHI